MRVPLAVNAAILVLLAITGACGDDGAETDEAAATTTTPADCRGVGEPLEVAPERRAVLPPGTIINVSADKGETTQLTGIVPLEPTAVYDYYEASDDLDLLGGEDEGHEAEVLATDGHTRVSLKVVRLCEGTSTIRAVVAAEVATTTTSS